MTQLDCQTLEMASSAQFSMRGQFPWPSKQALHKFLRSFWRKKECTPEIYRVDLFTFKSFNTLGNFQNEHNNQKPKRNISIDRSVKIAGEMKCKWILSDEFGIWKKNPNLSRERERDDYWREGFAFRRWKIRRLRYPAWIPGTHDRVAGSLRFPSQLLWNLTLDRTVDISCPRERGVYFLGQEFQGQRPKAR